LFVAPQLWRAGHRLPSDPEPPRVGRHRIEVSSIWIEEPFEVFSTFVAVLPGLQHFFQQF